MSAEENATQERGGPALDVISETINRRKALRYVMLGGAAVGANLGGRIWADAIWTSDNTELKVLPACRRWFPIKHKLAGEGWVTAPGLGRKHGEQYADVLATQTLDVPRVRLPMSYFNYANDGITARVIASHLAEQGTRCKEISLYGHSMGGPTQIEALRQLALEGYVLPVRRIILNGSPFDISDAHNDRWAKALAKLPYRGGVAGKFAINMTGSIMNDRRGFFRDLGHSVRHAAHEATHGASPMLWMSQLRLLDDVDFDAQWQDFQGVFTPDTEILICIARHDDTIKTQQSVDKYGAFFTKFGAKVTCLYLPPSYGHANTLGVGKVAKPWVARTNYDLAA